jgi:hypothetical protein
MGFKVSAPSLSPKRSDLARKYVFGQNLVRKYCVLKGACEIYFPSDA